jgi:carboxypeptidase PM20D1
MIYKMKKIIISSIILNLFTYSSFAQSESNNLNQSVINLSESIKFKTVSYTNQDNIDLLEFEKLHTFLEKAYPLIHKKLKREKINQSLLYKWEGKNRELKPIILMAHMDVVPIEKETQSSWLEEPFSGNIKNGYIWGRGSIDDKASVISILEACEKLLKENFIPERTIYFAFGHDEEIGGENGAKKISKLLEKNNIEAEFILDEGLSVTDKIIPKLEKKAALIGITEKGYASVELSIDIDGGHASMPDKENSITILSKAINKLNDNKPKSKITPTVKKFFENIGSEMPFPEKIIFSNLWLFEPLVINIFENTRTGNATLRTTTAITMFNSGVKDNVIPTQAKAVINFRILTGESSKELLKYVKDTINDNRIKVSFLSQINEPSEVSSTDSIGYKVIESTIKEVFDNTIVAPSMVLAGTDSKHYNKVSKDIYRFQPITLNNEDIGKIHGINERISIEYYLKSIDFYYKLMINYK